MRPRGLWWKSVLVLAIDLLWSLVLERFGRALFSGLYPGQQGSVNHLLNSQLTPMLWISYGIVLSAQIGWLAWASRQQRPWRPQVSRDAQRRRLQRAWWRCAVGQLALSIGLQLSQAWRLGLVDPAGLSAVLALLLCDLLVIYWLPTALLVPEELRSAVPLRGRWPWA